MSLEHEFYLVKFENIETLNNLDIYYNILNIERQNKPNGFNGINIIDKICINDYFIIFCWHFFKFIYNDKLEEMQIKSIFGLNYYGITILKNSEKMYNILNEIYFIFKPLEDIFYIQDIYIKGICSDFKIITKERYNNLYNKKSCKKVYKKDIIYIINKLKGFSLNLRDNKYYIIHCGI